MSKFSGRSSYDLPQSPLSVRFLKLLSPEVSAKTAASLVYSLCLIMFFFPNWCLFLGCLGCSLQGLFHLECSWLSPQVFLKFSAHFCVWTCRVQLLTHISCSRSFLIPCLLAVKLFELYILFTVLNRLLFISLSYTLSHLITTVLQLHF